RLHGVHPRRHLARHRTALHRVRAPPSVRRDREPLLAPLPEEAPLQSSFPRLPRQSACPRDVGGHHLRLYDGLIVRLRPQEARRRFDGRRPSIPLRRCTPWIKRSPPIGSKRSPRASRPTKRTSSTNPSTEASPAPSAT